MARTGRLGLDKDGNPAKLLSAMGLYTKFLVLIGQSYYFPIMRTLYVGREEVEVEGVDHSSSHNHVYVLQDFRVCV